MAEDPDCVGTAAASDVAPALGGWTTVVPAEASTGAEAPAWAVPDVMVEGNSQVGTTGGAPDKVPAGVPALAKEGPWGQTQVAHAPAQRPKTACSKYNGWFMQWPDSQRKTKENHSGVLGTRGGKSEHQPDGGP